MSLMELDLGTAILGAAIGGIVGAAKKDNPWKYALWGGGIGAAVSLAGVKTEVRVGEHFKVGQLPQSLPTPGLPGQVVYNLDPRHDRLLDPVSRRQMLPAWLLMHWNNNDPKIIAEVQGMLGAPADGVLGPGTSAAIRAFQSHAGLGATGVMDKMTMEALAGS